jgi:GntR family transcriptional repressor for pyruvate dehydrogenase complex
MAVVDEVTERIRRFVVERALEPGERLPSERELAERFGASRPAVRAALQRLADLGVLETRRGSGSYVAEIDELADVRRQLEPHAAALAAAHRDPATARHLRELAERMAGARDDPADFAALDAEVHREIARASGNRVLIGVLRDLERTAAHSRRRTVQDDANRADAAEHIATLVRAIDAGDAPAARAAMQQHLDGVRRR